MKKTKKEMVKGVRKEQWKEKIHNLFPSLIFTRTRQTWHGRCIKCKPYATGLLPIRNPWPTAATPSHFDSSASAYRFKGHRLVIVP